MSLSTVRSVYRFNRCCEHGADEANRAADEHLSRPGGRLVKVGEAYSTLPLRGSNAVGIGSAFISLVEPHRGHERAYTRWYEDDHVYAGAMAFPWWFAGRRWVATRDLQRLRYPANSVVARPLEAGCYLATYWIAPGHHDDQARWLSAAVGRLLDERRMFSERTHISTAFYARAASVRRDADGPRDFQALDHPYAGLVLEIVDAPHGGRDALLDWLVREHAPALLRAGPASQCVAFAPLPWPGHVDATWFEYAGAREDRLAVLWFLDDDPRDCWSSHFVGHGNAVAASGLGHVELIAPFIPTVPGTDRYVDELR